MLDSSPDQAAPIRPDPAAVDFPIVGIGASAGGLEACSTLLDVLPADTGMAFFVVQHLDPDSKSLLVDLLAKHTSMPVLQAAEDDLGIQQKRQATLDQVDGAIDAHPAATTMKMAPLSRVDRATRTLSCDAR